MFIGGSLGATDTRIEFEGDRSYDFQTVAVAAFAGYRMPSGWTLQGAVGSILGGELVGDEVPGTFDIGTGVVVSATAARRWAFGDGRWFANGSLSMAVARSPVDDENGMEVDPLWGTDLRLGATVGRTFAGMISPYAMVRLFGGPVLWSIGDEDVAGSDPTHLQLGGGVNVALSVGLSAVVDASVLGERSVSVGLSWQI